MINFCKKAYIVGFLIYFFFPITLFAQESKVDTVSHTVLKTNLLYWCTASLNIAAETCLSDHWTGELSLGYNPFTFHNNKKLKHVVVQPELRYWFDTPYRKHFVGGHLLYSHFNAGGVKFPFGIFSDLQQYRYQGNLGGIGAVYGYNLRLNDRWHMEFEAGWGLVYVDYKQYRCEKCGSQIGHKHGLHTMPTKLAINMVYHIK